MSEKNNGDDIKRNIESDGQQHNVTKTDYSWIDKLANVKNQEVAKRALDIIGNEISIKNKALDNAYREHQERLELEKIKLEYQNKLNQVALVVSSSVILLAFVLGYDLISNGKHYSGASIIVLGLGMGAGISSDIGKTVIKKVFKKKPIDDE